MTIHYKSASQRRRDSLGSEDSECLVVLWGTSFRHLFRLAGATDKSFCFVPAGDYLVVGRLSDSVYYGAVISSRNEAAQRLLRR